MITANDVKRLQTAVGSQDVGNNLAGNMIFKGGFACTNTGGVLGPVVGPFTVVPGSAFGEPAGVYRVYPKPPTPATQPAANTAPVSTNAVQSGAPTATIKSIDFFNVSGFTPRNPGVAETASALVTGYNVDAANGLWYITVQISTLTTGAILNTPPTNFVVGLDAGVTFNSYSFPL